MASSRSPLMDEIYDQFLVCKICYELYKRPKTLQCLHTFCMSCLEQHQDAELERSYRYMSYSRAISCPICRKKTELPSGGVRRLPDNFLVANLGAVIARRLPDTKVATCEICKPEVPVRLKPATCRCLDCSKLLCKRCVQLHRTTKVTQEHSIFDIEVEKDIECKVHKGETVRFYCEPCEMCICVVCAFQEHKGHEVSSFAEGMKKHSRSLDNLVDVCKERIDLVKDQLDLIYKCESQIKEAEESIRDVAIETISDIRYKEKETVQKMYDAYGDETLDFIKEKELLQDNLDNLQSTCNLTDIITKDRSMELLLLKKEIQEKLQNLLQRQVRQPPDNAMKEVKFIPGNVVFGYLSVKGGNGENVDMEVDESENYIKANAPLCNIPGFTADKNSYDVVLKDTMSQTEVTGNAELYTTMGHLLKQICDQLTQTDAAGSFERGTSPIDSDDKSFHMHTTNTEYCTNTTCNGIMPSTPTTRRKIQTNSIETADECTGTIQTQLTSTCTNTCNIDSMERSTLTQIQESRSKGTDTLGLVLCDESSTTTSQVNLINTSTTTDARVTLNKAIGTPQPILKDKRCNTTRIVRHDRDTMTNFVGKLDMSVTAKFEGTDKAIGTKTIVTVHSADGDADVRTRDQCLETPWKDEYVKTCDQATMCDVYKESYSTQSKEIGTASFGLRNVSVNTLPMSLKSRGVNTTALATVNKGTLAQQDLGTKKPTFATFMTQTTLTLGNIPNIASCHQGTITELTGDVQMVADSASHLRIQTVTHESSTTMSSVVSTADRLINTVTQFERPQHTIATCVPLVDVGTDANQLEMFDKQFGSRSVIYMDQGCGASSPGLISNGTLPFPETVDVSVETVNILEEGTGYPGTATISRDTSTLVDVHTNTDQVTKRDNFTMTLPVPLLSQHTTTFHNVNVTSAAVETTRISMVDHGEDPCCNPTVNVSSNTTPPSMASIGIVTEKQEMKTSSTTTNHNVETHDQFIKTDIVSTNDASTDIELTMADKSTHTRVHTSDVGVLKRPHTVTKGVGTKRSKLIDTSAGTDKTDVLEQMVMTSVTYGSEDIAFNDVGVETIPKHFLSQATGTPQVKSAHTSTSMPQIHAQDRMSSPINFNNSVDRSSSPIDFDCYTDRACSPILVETKHAGINVVSKTREAYTSTVTVRTKDTGSGYDKLPYVDKQNSPIRNLVLTRTRFTCTPHVNMTDRAGSPIPNETKTKATNTKVTSLENRGVSPEHVAVRDYGVLATAHMVTKSIGTPQVLTREQGAYTKQIRLINKEVGTPHLCYTDKGCSTPIIHTLHKNISTENIITRDQSTTMAAGVAEQYKDLVAAKKGVPCTRGTSTQTIYMQTKETSTPVLDNQERASSPILTETADKGVMANKAELLEARESYQGVGKGKTNRPLTDSPKPALSSIQEDSQESGSSSDECSSSYKDSFPDLPSFVSPRLGSPRIALFNPVLEGRPQMGLVFGNMVEREKGWRSSPTLGTSYARSHFGTTMGANMLHLTGRPPIAPVCRIEAATSTKDISTTNRATSTTDIEKEDKAVCTVPETVVMQGKMAECINKLKTVRQRLEQQPIYSTATVTKSMETDSESSKSVSSSTLLSVKSMSVGSNLHEGEGEFSPFHSPSLKRRPIVFSSTSESQSESSDQEQCPKSRLNKARKQRLEITQLLRSSSLPERPEVPGTSDGSNPSAVATSPPRQNEAKFGGPKIVKDQPKSPKEKSNTTKDLGKARLKSSRERPKSARSVETRERPALPRQHSHEGLRTPKDAPRVKRDMKSSKSDLETKRISSPRDKGGPLLSPKMQHKSRAKPSSKYDELHPLLPSSPRNTRRLSDGAEGVRARLGETPRQRRERLEQQLTFEDRKALTRQYFQDTRPLSPRVARPKSTKSMSIKHAVTEKPPRVPTPDQE